MAEELLSDLVHGIKGTRDYIKGRRALAAERRAANSPGRLPMASSEETSTTVPKPPVRNLPGAEKVIEAIESAVERTLQNPQGVIIKGQRRSNLQFVYLAKSMKVVKDDTAYIRRKIDLIEQKMGSGGGGSGGFFNTIMGALLRGLLRSGAIALTAGTGAIIKALTEKLSGKSGATKKPPRVSGPGRSPTGPRTNPGGIWPKTSGAATIGKGSKYNIFSKTPIAQHNPKMQHFGMTEGRGSPRVSLGPGSTFRMNMGTLPSGFSSSNQYNQRVYNSFKKFLNGIRSVPKIGPLAFGLMEFIEPVYLQLFVSDATPEQIDQAYIDAINQLPGATVGAILGGIAGAAVGTAGGPLGMAVFGLLGSAAGGTAGAIQSEVIANAYARVAGNTWGEDIYYYITKNDQNAVNNLQKIEPGLSTPKGGRLRKPGKSSTGRHQYKSGAMAPLPYAPVDTMTTGSINRNDPFTSLLGGPTVSEPTYINTSRGQPGPMFASSSTGKGDRPGYVRPYEGASSSGGRSRYSGGYDQNNPPGTDPDRMYRGGAATTQKGDRIRTLEDRVAEKMSGFNQNDSLADLIGRAEAGKAGYNAYNRGSAGEFDAPIKIEDMTIGQIQALQRLPKSDKNRILAVGKYQIIPSTLAGAVTFMGLDPNQKFDRATQDKIYREYLVKHKRREVYNYITGKTDNRNKAINGMSSEWAALKNAAGKGSHDNVGGNRATVSGETVGSHLDRLREKYSKLAASGMDPDQAWTSTFGTASGMDPADRELAVAAAKIDMENEKKSREKTGEGGVAMKGGRLSQKQQTVAGIRKDPLDDKLSKVLSYAAAQAGIDEVIINSGGQMSLAEAKAAGAKKRGNKWYLNGKAVRIGSERHDHGNAADLKLRMGNRILSMNNPKDVPFIEAFMRNSVKAGATGIGMGSNYMGSETMHIGFGTTAIWGKGRPGFVDRAFAAGLEDAKNFDLSSWEESNIDKLGYSDENFDARTAEASFKPKVQLPEEAPIPTVLGRQQYARRADDLMPRTDAGDPSIPIPTPRPENVPIPTPRPDIDSVDTPLDPMITQPAETKTGPAVPIPTPNPRNEAPVKSGCLDPTYMRAITKAKTVGGSPTYGSLLPLELFFDN